jgi:hypothetical protein
MNKNRPLGVSIYAVFIFISAGQNLVKYALSNNYAMATRLLLCLVCAAYIAIGFGLIKMMKWAWEAALALNIGSIIMIIVILFKFDLEPAMRYIFYAGMMICTVYVVYLTRPRVIKAFTAEEVEEDSQVGDVDP